MGTGAVLVDRPPEGLSMWVIYDHPKGFPDDFVVRECMVSAGGKVMHGLFAKQYRTLEEARESVRQGRICIHRHPCDDPIVVESWV